MIKITYDAGTVEAGGHVVRIDENIRERIAYQTQKNLLPPVVNVRIDGYDKDHEFDVSLQNGEELSCVVIKLDDGGGVVVTKMTEQNYLAQKHLEK